MTTGTVAVSPDWLRLREASDAQARSDELVADLDSWLPADRPAVIHDLGCGTGSMGRWLAPKLSGRQHWILYDRDPALLARAAAEPAGPAADGSQVTCQTRQRDITRLQPEDLTRASLITASALLDMMTGEELERFVTTCTDAGCGVLVTISVVGRVELLPADELDDQVQDAFNEHQRRDLGAGSLLGPDAAEAAVAAFTRAGCQVLVRSSPWLLGPGDSELIGQWFTGWLDAACEQRPGLAAATASYRQGRLADLAAARMAVTVHHTDLLVRPR
jgi:hypothetical protein